MEVLIRAHASLADGSSKASCWEYAPEIAATGRWGRVGRGSGEFENLHNIAIDGKGNIYTAEVQGERAIDHVGSSCHRVSADAQTAAWPSTLPNPPILRQPAIDGRTIDTENISDNFRAFTILNPAHRAFPRRLQRGVIQSSRIVCPHVWTRHRA